MSLSIQDKQRIVSEIRMVASRALSLVIADPGDMKGSEAVELRKEGRKCNVYLRLVKNSLIPKILGETPFECLKDVFCGPTLMGFSIKEPSDAARLFQNFSKNHDKFKIKVAVFENKVICASQIEILSNLPTYMEAITILISFIREISIMRLVNLLSLIMEQKR